MIAHEWEYLYIADWNRLFKAALTTLFSNDLTFHKKLIFDAYSNQLINSEWRIYASPN